MEKIKRSYNISKENLERRTLKSKESWERRRQNGEFDTKVISIRVPTCIATFCIENGFQPYHILEYIAFGTIPVEKIRELYK